jgi:hypothetical protein
MATSQGDIIFFTGPGVKLLSSTRVADNLTADRIMISSGRRWEEGFQSANLKFQMAGAGSLTIEKIRGARRRPKAAVIAGWPDNIAKRRIVSHYAVSKLAEG